MCGGGIVKKIFHGAEDIGAAVVGNTFGGPLGAGVAEELTQRAQGNSPTASLESAGLAGVGSGISDVISGAPLAGSGVSGISDDISGLLSSVGIGGGADAAATGAAAADANSFAPLDNAAAATAQQTGSPLVAAPTAGSGANGAGGGLLNTSSLNSFNPDPAAANAVPGGAAQSTVGSSAAPSNGIMSTINKALGTNASAGDLLKYGIPLAGVANSIISQQKQTKGLNQLEQAGAGGLSAETGLINTLQSGVLPPGAQATIDQQVNDSITAIKSHYAGMGMSGSSSEQQDIAAARQSGVTTAFNYASQATNTGLQALGANNSIYNSIMQSVLSQNQGLSSSLANLAAASTGVNKLDGATK